jgi:hypothetical protein
MQITVQVLLEHGIMFLYDPYAEVKIPSDTGASPITYTENCICFQVAPYVDGQAHVILSDEGFDGIKEPTFTIDLPAPSKYISLTDVPVNYYGMLRLKGDTASINIWNYEENGSERTWVQITNLDTF